MRSLNRHHRHRQQHIDTYLTRIPPHEWQAVNSIDYPITDTELNNIVAEDDDLWFDDKQQIRIKSHPDGEPLIVEDGWAYIRKDDAITIEKMAELATLLDGWVINDNGDVFTFEAGETKFSSQRSLPSDLNIQVDTEEECLRQRQIDLLIVILMIPTAVFSLLWWNSGQGIIFLVGAILCLALAVWAALFARQKKFTLSKHSNGSWSVHRRNRKSTSDQVNVIELESIKIRQLELVWHPLKYPASTRIEFQVRLNDHPWLVLFTSYNEDKARASLESTASRLGLSVRDGTFGAPANDIDSQYLLKKHESSEVSKTAIWITVSLFGLAAAALIWLIEGRSAQITGYVLGLIAVILASGQLLKPNRKNLPEKYRQWIK